MFKPDNKLVFWSSYLLFYYDVWKQSRISGINMNLKKWMSCNIYWQVELFTIRLVIIIILLLMDLKKIDTGAPIWTVMNTWWACIWIHTSRCNCIFLWSNLFISVLFLLMPTLASRTWKANELSLQNWRWHWFPHQYVGWSGQPPTGLKHTSRKSLWKNLRKSLILTKVLLFNQSLCSCTIMCLTPRTSQGTTTSPLTRLQLLLRVALPWATLLTLRASTTLHLLHPTPVNINHLSTLPPTSRTTTPQHPSPTPSLSQPLTPLPRLQPAPGSVSRSKQHSPSPTPRPGGRLNRPTPLLPLVSTCHGPNLRLRHSVLRVGTLNTLVHKVKICTLRLGSRGAAQGLEDVPTMSLSPREGWTLRLEQELCRVLLISPAR